jgi:hypothetical protein
MKRYIALLFIITLFSCQKELLPTKREEACTVRYAPNSERQVPVSCEIQSAVGPTPNVTFYDEYDYATYTFFGKDTAKAYGYIRSAQEYERQAFLKGNIRVSFITYLWTTPSPYSGSVDVHLDQFGARMDSLGKIGQAPNADLYSINAKGASGGGVAYVNTLCLITKRFKCRAASINCSLTGLPKYNWDAVVKTHEDGHLLGSNHTHACAWLIDGTYLKLDDCGGLAGYGSGSCPPDPVPLGVPNNRINFGHIMSYCDLAGGGVRFDSGFVDKPGILVYNNIINKQGCLVNPNGGVVTPCKQDTTYTSTYDKHCKDSVKVRTITLCPTGSKTDTIVKCVCVSDTLVKTEVCYQGTVTKISVWDCATKSYSAYKTTDSTCKAQPCISCVSPKVITCSISVRLNDIFVNRSGYTNYYYDWYDNGIEQTTIKVNYKDGSSRIVALSQALDGCGNLPQTGVADNTGKIVTSSSVQNNGWQQQSVNKAKLIKGHVYACVVRSTNRQTSTNCYIMCTCQITY